MLFGKDEWKEEAEETAEEDTVGFRTCSYSTAETLCLMSTGTTALVCTTGE